MLERYGHGGDLRSAAELYGIPEKKLLDYSSNMNPLGPPPCVAQVLQQYIGEITAYPDPAVRQLREVIAQKFNINSNEVIVGNGAAELIDLIIRYFRPESAAILTPSFIEYEQALQKIGCHISYIEAKEQRQFVVDVQDVEALTGERTIQLYLLGHPNNPTGQLLSSKLILYLLSTGAIVVLDEAFIDFHNNEEAVSWIAKVRQYSNLFVIRSMTKFYSIPGIRLGYAVGNRDVLSAMKELQYPWSVNSLAQQIGIHVFQDEDFSVRTKQWLTTEITWMTEKIKQLELIPYETVTNYMLIRIPETCYITSEQLQMEMGMQGILIRNAQNFRGLNNSFIRLAIKTRAYNEACIETISSVLMQHKRGVQNE